MILQLKIKTEEKPIIIIALVTALCLLGNSMLYVTLPLYWKEVGLRSLWEVGLLLSINRIVRVPLNPLIGWLYNKITLRTGLVAAVVFATIATIGYGIFEGIWVWLFLRCSWGLSWSLLKLGGFFTVISCSTENNRGNLMGKYNGLHRLGDFFGMLLGGFLTSVISFKKTIFLFGLIICLGIPLTFLFAPINRLENTRTTGFWVENKFVSGDVLRVIASGLLIYMLFEGMLTSTLSLVIYEHFNSFIILFGITVSTTAFAGLLQALRWLWEPFLAPKIGYWSDASKGRLPLFITFLFIAFGGFALLPLKTPLIFWVSVVIIIMISATALVTLVDALASDVAKMYSSTMIIAIYTVALDIGAALGPLLSYQIISLEHGIKYTYIGGALIFLFIAMLWYHSPQNVKPPLNPKS